MCIRDSRQTAETLLERLKAGESFSRLAREFSEDERSAPAGGELGWINPARAKETLGLALADVPDDKPVLLKSRWGWHLVEASPVKKGKTPSYEEALPALRDATRSLRKAQAVGLYKMCIRDSCNTFPSSLLSVLSVERHK